jgi:hypothetical protein
MVPSILSNDHELFDRKSRRQNSSTIIWKSLIVSILLCSGALEKSVTGTWLILPFVDEDTTVPTIFLSSALTEQHSDDISICFITSQYGTNASKTDRIVDVREVVPNLYALSSSVQQQQTQTTTHVSNGTTTTNTPTPVVHFFVYTNLPDLDAPGWKIIVRDFPLYQRLITQSRWAKFQAFHDPIIQSHCEVAYYMDGVMTLINHILPYQKQARRILDQAALEGMDGVAGVDVHAVKEKDDSNSTPMVLSTNGVVGLAQNLHFPPKRGRTGRQYNRIAHHDDTPNDNILRNRTSSALSSMEYTLQKELMQIIVKRKDTEENVQKLQVWLESQSDFSWDCPMMYSNNAFGYAVHSMKFQQAANFLWEHYSKEEDSVRIYLCHTVFHY